ncbi:aldo/keto reductase [Halobacteria archaeon AArc-curdl1]|uniref:Aldo/keto reductase n=1 Tax=Natronosalvus hydrolyticus TaxID=2979988 RepID=A0AAP2Z7T1_9EURY|nr:aldo/keto reductase [Halobacteria archaeon AArc-curdl1]
MVTGSATWDYRDRFYEDFGRTYFRRYGDGLVSSIGLGTYLGAPTDEVDERYVHSIEHALELGCNVVDTAINYRHQRSERAVGRALEQTDVDREAIFVSTKGGFVPFDRDRPDDPGGYVKKTYVDTGVIDRGDLVAGSHCIAPDYIEGQLDRSLENLGLDSIDCYYVHNPETQRREQSPESLYEQLEATFTRLEERASAGDISHYGVATWDAFRVPAEHQSHLSIAKIVDCARAAAREAGTGGTHFRAIQLPFNVAMADAFTVKSQAGADGNQSVLWFAANAGLDVFTSASIAQGDLLDGLPEGVAAVLEGETTAQRAINFARSAPGVTSSLVGMSRPAHVEENIGAGRYDPLGADTFDDVFE